MKYPFSKIIIIYNPNSTGNSELNARSLKKDILKTLVNVPVQVVATKRAGHAERIAADYAQENEPILLISSSGDGGYNEVVNGVQKVPGSNVTVCVLPSGNANDHDTATSQSSILERIVAGKTVNIDLIRLSSVKEEKEFVRYAHSYVGFGLTAYIGKKLTETKLNPINEKWLVVKYFLKFQYVTLQITPNKSWYRYSSVVIGNIDRMSKAIKLGNNSAIDDGKIELYVTRPYSSLSLIWKLVRASARGLQPLRTGAKFTITPKHSVNVQLDGEMGRFETKQQINITVAKQALRTLV